VHTHHILNRKFVRDHVLIRAAARSIFRVEAHIMLPLDVRQRRQPKTDGDIFGIVQPETLVCINL